jgi:hypothetical protein
MELYFFLIILTGYPVTTHIIIRRQAYIIWGTETVLK